MQYPFWDISIGYGQLIGVVSVIHVFISHFAIGGGLYLVLTEMMARKAGDEVRLKFLQKLSKFFVLVTLVGGALSGVAIWFVVGLISPAAIEVLIHHFVWAWGIEWTLFVVEITSALLYFYGWQRLSGRDHLTLGWIYFITAWLSLFVINGIITFMLTPGDWLETGNFWDGFFNETFWPSLFFRTGLSVMLAGLYALLVSTWGKGEKASDSLLKLNSAWAIFGLVIMVPTFLWYQAAIPNDLMETARQALALPFVYMTHAAWIAAAMALLLILFGMLLTRWFNFFVASLLMVMGLMLFGNFEWWRESVRKPYVITGYMYANGVELAHSEEYQQNGYLASIKFRTGDDGADLFRHACKSCHTMTSYRAIRPALDGTDKEFIEGIIKGVHTMYGNMPPFLGSEEEIGLLAAHINKQINHKSLSEIYGLTGMELGQKVYQIRCGGCHQIGGWNDKTETLAEMDEEELNDLLDEAGELADEMPAFTANDVERQLLIEFLMTLNKGESDESSGL